MKHFFISYTGADQAWAEWIAWQLDSAGYSYEFQAWDFRPGENFIAEMHKGLIEAERVIAVLSPRYLQSRFAEMEWQAALADKAIDKLLPILIEECDVEGLLRAIIYIKLVGLDENAAKQKLLAGVQRGRAKPTTAPAFPMSTGAATAPQRPFPGKFPAVWNIPFPRNPNFTGRDELIAQLRAVLQSGQATALTQPQAIHGLGGVGKTQLAVEYAYRHASEYDIVWFVRAESPALIAADLAELARPLQLPERDEREQVRVVQAVQNYLRQHDRWLVIFDNAEDPKDVRAFLPQGNGHTLITSRNPNWSATAHAIDVQVLPRDKAIEFLLRRTQTSEVSETSEVSSQLADELGCLPLALEQAGAYIEASGITIGEYLQRYRAHQRELLSKPPATDYPATVATTWDISFATIATQSPASVALLNLLAFFARDMVRHGAIIAGAEHLPEPLKTVMHDELKLDDAVTPLRRYSLVQVSYGMFVVHPLVKAIVRDRLSKPQSEIYSEAAHHCENDRFVIAYLLMDNLKYPLTEVDKCQHLKAHYRVKDRIYATHYCRELYQTGLAIGNSFMQGIASYLMGVIYFGLGERTGDLERATELFRQSALLFQSSFTDERTHNEGVSWLSVGEVYSRQCREFLNDRWAESIDGFTRAAELFNQINDPLENQALDQLRRTQLMFADFSVIRKYAQLIANVQVEKTFAVPKRTH